MEDERRELEARGRVTAMDVGLHLAAVIVRVASSLILRSYMLNTMGARASAAWLEDRGLDTRQTTQWYVEITLIAPDTDYDVGFELNIYPEEWGYILRAGSRVSSIRITDIPFVHGRDDHQLLSVTPELANIGRLVTFIETRKAVVFHRTQAHVRSNLARATSVVRAWLNMI